MESGRNLKLRADTADKDHNDHTSHIGPHVWPHKNA